jgi:hypothetical protein
MRFSERLRQDPILLLTCIAMAVGILGCMGLLAYWTLALIPLYPPQPCAPDGQREAAWILLTLL